MRARAMVTMLIVTVTACAGGGVSASKGARHAVPQLDAALNRVVTAADPVATAAAFGFDVTVGGILVEVVLADAAEVEALTLWLAGHGAVDTRSWHERVLTRVPATLLVDLAQQRGVTMVRRPSTAVVSPEPSPAKEPPTSKH